MYIYIPNETAPSESVVGGKARNLWLLQRNFKVPPWFALTTQAFADVALPDITGNMADYLRQAPWPEKLQTELQQAVASLCLQDKYLAVRSSAAGEDGSEYSYAGQLQSLLYVRFDELAAAVREVWASAYSERCLQYRKQHGLEHLPLKVAVVVQEMIDADCAGVAFGADPLTGDTSRLVISAVYGLGEGLVADLVDADVYRVNVDGITKEIAEKKQAVVFDAAGGKGTMLVDIEPQRQNLPCLSEKQLDELAGLVKEINLLCGRPQDIEWALRENSFFLLQTRPITALRESSCKTVKIWDNSNIVESYAGVTTPLTFSFIREIYTEVYREFCRIMGVEEELIAENSHVFEMLGLIQGRVYYDLQNWYQVLSLLPGYDINARFMEEMMGVKERMDILPSVIHSKKNPYLRLGKLAFCLSGRLLSLPKDIRHFEETFNRSVNSYAAADFAALQPEELVNIYHQLQRVLLKNWHAPLVNDFFAMIFFGLLRRLTEKWLPSEPGTLQNDLLTGEGGIISTEPVNSIIKIACLINGAPELKTAFLTLSAAELPDELNKYPDVRLAFAEHLQRFGIRCGNELKLETVTYQHEPAQLAQLLQMYIRNGWPDPGESRERERGIRQAAENRVRGALRYKPLKMLVFTTVLRHARAKIKNRENLRFERTRIFALVREIFLALGHKLHHLGVLAQPRDIFYLTKEEIFSYIEGRSCSVSLQETVALRSREYQEYEEQAPPERFSTCGPVYLSLHQAAPHSAEGHEDTRRGIGCSPGKVRGQVRIVTDPMNATDLEGCIMVAERTDPGWVPLFPLVRAILVERGSLLSHSAIVAREMGIPAVVALTGLIRWLKDGDLIEMDGTAGTVRIVKEADNER